jgi:hypothetical protein
LISKNSLPNPSWDRLTPPTCSVPIGASHAVPQTHKPHLFRTRNDLDKAQRTRSKSNESTARSTKLIDILPLITVWLKVRVLSGPTTKSIAIQSPVGGRVGLSPQVSGVPSSSERAACIAPNAEKFDNQKRGQLLSFSFAVPPNRTMSL